MNCNVDLHTHTKASDGQYAPADLVLRAKSCGIDCLAITDHDSLDGLDEAMLQGKASGVSVLRGVELGAAEDRHLHILGYAFHPLAMELRTLCHKLRDGRDERKFRILSFLAEKQVHISLDEVEAVAGGDIIARPHFAQIMLRHGYVSSIREAFDRYLDTDEYQRIERFKATAQTCIQTIQQVGGSAVLAHPYQLHFSDEKLESLVKQLKDFGLEGIECYYPRHSPEQVRQYLALAKKYSLHITAGSDFHGEAIRPDTDLIPTDLDITWLYARD